VRPRYGRPTAPRKRDESTSTLTYNVESSISLAFDGAFHNQTVAFGADTLTTTGSSVNAFDGEIILINEWKRAE
jgi:hypothetical protein